MTSGTWVASTSFPSLAYVSGAAAATAVGKVWLSRPWRRAADIALVVLLVVMAMAGSSGVPDLLFATALGIAVGAAVLVAVGAPNRRPTPAAVAAGLAAAGLEVDQLTLQRAEGGRAQLYVADISEATPVFVKVYAGDTRDADLLYRGYRALILRGPSGEWSSRSLAAEVENEALLLLLAAPRRRPLSRAPSADHPARQLAGPGARPRARRLARCHPRRAARRRPARRRLAGGRGPAPRPPGPPVAPDGQPRRRRGRSARDHGARLGCGVGDAAPDRHRSGRAAHVPGDRGRPRAGRRRRGPVRPLRRARRGRPLPPAAGPVVGHPQAGLEVAAATAAERDRDHDRHRATAARAARAGPASHAADDRRAGPRLLRAAAPAGQRRRQRAGHASRPTGGGWPWPSCSPS